MIDITDKRFWLWIGKWQFPEINTKKTKLQFIPRDHPTYYLPIPVPLHLENRHPADISADVQKTARVDIGKYGYNGRNHAFTVRFGYSRELDTLLVMQDSYRVMGGRFRSNGTL